MLYAIPMVLYLVVFGIIYMLIALRIKNLPGKTAGDVFNEFVYASMWFVGAAIYPFAYSPTIDPAIEEFFQLFTDLAMVGIFLTVVVIIGRQKILVSRRAELKEERCFHKFASCFDKDYSFKKDIMRKAFHGFVPAFVLAAYITGNLVVSMFSLDFVSGHDMGLFFIINCGFGGLFLFAAADIIRLSCFFEEQRVSIFHLLPTTVLGILTKRMHVKELTTFVPTVLILLSFIPFLPTPFAVFSSVSLIASISDAMASITGKAFSARFPGKLVIPGPGYRFYKGKNVPGYVAGFLSTLAIVILMFHFFPVPGVAGTSIFAVALLVSMVFLAVDFLSPPLNDNLLNPLACGLVMVIYLML